MGVLLPLLRQHLSPARVDALPFIAFFRTHRCNDAGQCRSGHRQPAREAGLRRSGRVRSRHAMGKILGCHQHVAGHALRGLLLPGDRVLHRTSASPCSKAAHRACTSSRFPAGNDALGACDCGSGFRPRDRGLCGSRADRRAQTVDELERESIPARRAAAGSALGEPDDSRDARDAGDSRRSRFTIPCGRD